MPPFFILNATPRATVAFTLRIYDKKHKEQNGQALKAEKKDYVFFHNGQLVPEINF